MEYRSLGAAGAQVSPLCLGTMMFGGPADEAVSRRIMAAGFERGVNFFDTANMYTGGESERIVGRFVGERRHSIVLATKGRQPVGNGPNDRGASRLHLMRALEESLERLSVEHIDLYYVHAPDAATPIEETLRALDDMVRQGKVRYLGCSNYRAWQLCEALWTSDRLRLERFVCVEPLYNVVNRDIEVELLPLCRRHGVGVVSYSPLARGILTAKYLPGAPPPADSRASRNDRRMREAEWREESLDVAQRLASHARNRGVSSSQFALAWCLANANITSVIVGPRTVEQLEDNLGCLDVQITAEDEAFVDQLVPPGEHSGRGFQDPAYPITGRARRTP